MKIKGILFDKDGTLIEFNSLWMDSTRYMIEDLFLSGEILGEYKDQNFKEDLLYKLGINGKNVSANSPVGSGTIFDMAKVISEYFNYSISYIENYIIDYYMEFLNNNKDKIKPVGNVKDVFENLKNNGYKIGIATSDSYKPTKFALDYLGLTKYIDFIGTSDRYICKPNPNMLDIFCRENNLSYNEVIHVGDTPTDMLFGRHSKASIGVLSGIASKELLKKYTPYVFNNIEDIFETSYEKNQLSYEKIV